MCDSTRAAVHQLLCGGDGGIDALVRSSWLHADLPAGIAQANAVCSELSDARQTGPLAAKMHGELARALAIPPTGFSRAARCDRSAAWYVELQAALRARFQAAMLGAGTAAAFEVPLQVGGPSTSVHVAEGASEHRCENAAAEARCVSPRHAAMAAAVARVLGTMVPSRHGASAAQFGAAQALPASRSTASARLTSSMPLQRASVPPLKRLSASMPAAPAARKASKSAAAAAVAIVQMSRVHSAECGAEHTDRDQAQQLSWSPATVTA